MEYAHRLADDEKRELLRIARATLREHFDSGRLPPGKPHRASLLAPAGVFVSLHRARGLRGSVGRAAATTPLYRAVQEMAVAAATTDARFAPLTEDELDLVTLEVAVLSDGRRVRGPDDLALGVDGVAIACDDHRAVLLPQTAVEEGWDAATLCARVSAEAGLADDAWRRADAELTAFQVQVFSDLTHPPPPRA